MAVGEKRPITVETPKTDVPCKVTQTAPRGQQTDLPTKKVPRGFEAMFAPLEEGPHLLKVDLAGKDIPGSPFKVNVGPQTSKVEVKGLDTRK